MIAGVLGQCARCERVMYDGDAHRGEAPYLTFCLHCHESGYSTGWAVQSGGRWIDRGGDRLVREPVVMELADAMAAALRLGARDVLVVPEELLPHVGDTSRARVRVRVMFAELVPAEAPAARGLDS